MYLSEGARFVSFHFLYFHVPRLCSFIGSVLIILGLYLINWGQKTSNSALEALSFENQVIIYSSGDLKEPLLGYTPKHESNHFVPCLSSVLLLK